MSYLLIFLTCSIYFNLKIVVFNLKIYYQCMFDSILFDIISTWIRYHSIFCSIRFNLVHGKFNSVRFFFNLYSITSQFKHCLIDACLFDVLLIIFRHDSFSVYVRWYFFGLFWYFSMPVQLQRLSRFLFDTYQ